MEKSEESSPSNHLNAQKASRKEWIGLAVLALPCVLYSMDLTVLNLALPSLSATLKPSSSQSLWIVDIYGFIVAGWLITMGTLGDRVGRRKLLMIGAAAFGAASVLAAFSNSASMLIATRALLGIAGATLAPSTLSLISNMFHDPRQRTFAIGVWATSYSVGGAMGPLIGGLMLQHFWWGSVFLIGVPVMVLLLILGPQLLPEFHNPKAERIDLLSVALSLTSILSIIYSMKQIAQDGIGLPPLITFVIGIMVGAIFLRRQKTLDHPFIDLALFGKSTFNTALATNTFTMFVAFGSFFFIAQYLQLVLGLSPFQAGLWTMPSSIGFVAGSMFTPMVVRYLRPAYVISAGLLLASIGFGMFTQIDKGGLVLLVVGSVVMSLGVCPAIILSTDLIVGATLPERSGSAASLSETSAELGGALGIAVLGSIGTFIYRNVMAKYSLPGVSLQLKKEAGETIGGASGLATQLSDPLKADLLQTSQDAFTKAFELTSVISASIAVIISIALLIVLQRSKATSA